MSLLSQYASFVSSGFSRPRAMSAPTSCPRRRKYFTIFSLDIFNVPYLVSPTFKDSCTAPTRARDISSEYSPLVILFLSASDNSFIATGPRLNPLFKTSIKTVPPLPCKTAVTSLSVIISEASSLSCLSCSRVAGLVTSSSFSYIVFSIFNSSATSRRLTPT